MLGHSRVGCSSPSFFLSLFSFVLFCFNCSRAYFSFFLMCKLYAKQKENSTYILLCWTCGISCPLLLFWLLLWPAHLNLQQNCCSASNERREECAEKKRERERKKGNEKRQTNCEMKNKAKQIGECRPVALTGEGGLCASVCVFIWVCH